MIPKIIWQTYKSEYPPLVAQKCIKSWLDLNPNYEWLYFDDDACEQFIKDHFSTEYYQLYTSLPFGVMKADMWRIAIVYIYGGFYADLDTFCHHNLDSWVGEEELLVSVETPHGSICNYFFGATPRHPALLLALEYIKDCYNSSNYLNKEYLTATPIQNFGAHAFSSGIQKYRELNPLDSKARYLAYDDHEVAPWPDHRTHVSHQTASEFWRDGYDSWRVEQKNNFGV